MTNWKSIFCAAALALGATATAAHADVILRSYDGTFEATGQLMNSDGNFYVIQTDIGELQVRKEFVECLGNECPGAAVTPEAESMAVELRSLDGTSSFSGDLLGFDGTTYSLRTSLGDLQIRGEFVECVGAGCPVEEASSEAFSIALPASVGEALIGEALRRFADEKSLNVTGSFSSDGSGTQYLVGDATGAVIADISVVPAGGTAAIEALARGNAAFAIARDRVAPEAIASIFNVPVEAAPTVLDEKTVALDAVTPVIHGANPALNMSEDQIADILSGRTTNWQTINGNDAPITLYGLAASSELSNLLTTRLLAPRRLQAAPAAQTFATPEELNAAVAGDELGFAMAYRSGVDGTSTPSVSNACGIVASPSPFTLQTEEYPLTLRWHIYTRRGQVLGETARSLAEYLLTNEGQAAVSDTGLVGLAVGREPMFTQGERLLSGVLAGRPSSREFRTYRDYLAQVANFNRLSTTMRFLSGSAQLDGRAERDVRRISDLVSSGAVQGRDLVLIGFSDSVGDFGANIRLSKFRADQVKAALLAENIGFIEPADIQTFGFGPVAPVGCNNIIPGRDMNRRVEVWVR